MKLIRAEFTNFRLLRDLTLDFSTDSKKRLTVVRAENETGKTTILNALQWALYGDDGLPGAARDYRIHPIDWDGTSVPISAQVDFELVNFRRSSRDLIEDSQQYRIIRSALETIDDSEHSRSPSTVKLFHLSENGWEPIDNPELQIREELPLELREVFFTDGDRALSFIEAIRPTKRDRVKQAIRSLLGLSVIEDALNHIKKTKAEINKASKSIGAGEKLTTIAERIEQIQEESDSLEEKIKDSKGQFASYTQKLSDIKKEIRDALIKGNRQDLEREISQIDQQREHITNEQNDAAKDHSYLFRTLALSRDLIAPMLEKGREKLSELHAQRKIPNTTIPVLEERIQQISCICGESLDARTSGGARRREHIQYLITESQKIDDIQSSLTDLYFGSRSLFLDEERWIAEYSRTRKRRSRLESIREKLASRSKILEIKLKDLPDTDIQELQVIEKEYENQCERFSRQQIQCETLLEELKKEHARLALQHENLLREHKKGALILAELDVAKDVERALKNSYDRIANEELTKVSELMNSIFLEMIGADPEQGAIIQKAKISDDFDIQVYGPNNLVLDPDRDLNGASRRALTLALILALTKVSEVEAPNVIDTPLGMMSGYVKQSVLKTAIRESSQLILFLTRSEIADCEGILDSDAGRVITLTNPAHFPRMLVNEPQVEELKVLRCECNHREECTLCLRQMDVESVIQADS